MHVADCYSEALAVVPHRAALAVLKVARERLELALKGACLIA